MSSIGYNEGNMSKKSIFDAIKKPGARRRMRRALGFKEGKPIPAGELAAKAPGKMGQRARLAQTLKGLKK